MADVEVIEMGYRLLLALGLGHRVVLRLNSLGTAEWCVVLGAAARPAVALVAAAGFSCTTGHGATSTLGRTVSSGTRACCSSISSHAGGSCPTRASTDWTGARCCACSTPRRHKTKTSSTVHRRSPIRCRVLRCRWVLAPSPCCTWCASRGRAPPLTRRPQCYRRRTRQRFSDVQSGLEAVGVPFTVDQRLVRGLVREGRSSAASLQSRRAALERCS